MRLDTRHAPHLAFPVVVLCVCAPDLPAQQPPESGGALVGVVRDELTELPVSNASVLVEGTDLRGLTDDAGAFSIDGAPDGPQLLRISRFGYDDLVVPVRVGDEPERLELYLQPRPLLLEGMEVTGRSESVLAGAVVDARTGEGLPWALLRLGDRRPQSADGRGSFRIDDASPGSHLLLVERLGYESIYVPVTLGGDVEPLVVELEPDPIMLEGIEVMVSRFEQRRNAYGFGPVRAFDEGRLRRSGATDVVQFLRNHGSVPFTPCEGRSASADCYPVAGERRPAQSSHRRDAGPVWPIHVGDLCAGGGPPGRDLRRRRADPRLYPSVHGANRPQAAGAHSREPRPATDRVVLTVAGRLDYAVV
ncbi:MAG: carboxypeptidase-like regulatory domain-containing protein [Gemmatimonadota bacterium]|nr:carboxypeptidase-like regulatory domain-containing protein [Gemmatimonadota bacterium]